MNVENPVDGQQGLEDLFKSLDGNGDSKITPFELADSIDSNGDGKLSQQELLALAQKFQQMLAGVTNPEAVAPQNSGGADNGGGHGGGGGSHDCGAKADAGNDPASWYEQLDLDGDGTVSPQEMMQALDKNRDGQISADELTNLLDKINNADAGADTGGSSSTSSAA